MSLKDLSEARRLDAAFAADEGSAAFRASVAQFARFPRETQAQLLSQYSQRNMAGLVRCCLVAGTPADSIASGTGGSTPLLLASQHGASLAVQALLEAGADASRRDVDGDSSLYLAAREGHTRCVELLTAGGADVEAKGKDTFTPLLAACWKGHLETATLLLSKRASVAACDQFSSTALHVAAQYGFPAIVNLLVAAGAALEAKNDRGQTPLYIAAAKGRAGSLSALLSKGADVNAASGASGGTPLMAAILAKSALCVRVLLPTADVFRFNGQGWNALHSSVATANEECFLLLLPHFPDVDVRTQPGASQGSERMTALHIACQRGQTEMAKALLRRGASPVAEDGARRTPVHTAAEFGQLSCLIALLGRPGKFKLTRAQVDAREADGGTALHLSAYFGWAKCAGALIEAGAQLDLRTVDNHTPLEVARLGHPGNAELLALLEGRVPVHAPGTVCDYCSQPDESGARLKMCSSCRMARYCGPACVQAHWPAHKAECRRVKAEREAVTSVY